MEGRDGPAAIRHMECHDPSTGCDPTAFTQNLSNVLKKATFSLIPSSDHEPAFNRGLKSSSVFLAFSLLRGLISNRRKLTLNACQMQLNGVILLPSKLVGGD